MPRKNLSVLKRVRQSEKRHIRNKAIKTQIKNLFKKLIQSKEKEREELFRKFQSIADKAARKKIIHKNKIARLKSRAIKYLKKEK